jgi:hypothetical protein
LSLLQARAATIATISNSGSNAFHEKILIVPSI